MSYETIVLFILLLLIIIFIYLIKYRNKKENFNDMPTSQSLYSTYNSKEFDAQMYMYRDTLGDIDNLLMMYGCGINIGMAPNALQNLVVPAVQGLFYVPLNVSPTYNFQDVHIKINDIIEKFYNENNNMPLEGQVYVVIAQSPYYRDSNNNVITLQYNASSYLNLPMNVMNSDSLDTISLIDKIQFYGYVIFTAYDNNKNLITDMNKRKQVILNIKKSFRQKEKLCSIVCPQNKSLLCGCASQSSPYTTNCVESSVNSKMTPGEKYTYAILYRVNPRFANSIGREMLTQDYSDLQISPDQINPIPVVPPPSPPPSSPPSSPPSITTTTTATTIPSATTSVISSSSTNWKGYTISTDGQCGKIRKNGYTTEKACPDRQCCSSNNECGGSSGNESDWCDDRKRISNINYYHGRNSGKYDGVEPGK